MDSEDTARQYCAKLTDKLDLLGRFARETAKLKEAIASKETEQIVLHVQERRRVVDRIERMDKEVERFSLDRGFSIEKLSKKAQGMVGDCLDKIKASLQALVHEDNECLALAHAEHDSMKADIVNVRNGLQVARGYGRPSMKRPRFLDVKR